MANGELKFRTEDIDDVARMLAEAFLVRVERYNPEDRIRFLKACRRHMEATSPDLSKVFFEVD